MSIKKGNFGNFLCPPQHPNHVKHWEFKEGGFCSLDYILEEPQYFPELVSYQIKGIFELYNQTKPPVDSEEVLDWIYYCHGYFHHCFVLDVQKPLNVNNNVVVYKKHRSNRKLEMLYATHYIRKYYPEYTPSISHLKNAYCGMGEVRMYKPKRKTHEIY